MDLRSARGPSLYKLPLPIRSMTFHCHRLPLAETDSITLLVQITYAAMADLRISHSRCSETCSGHQISFAKPNESCGGGLLGTADSFGEKLTADDGIADEMLRGLVPAASPRSTTQPGGLTEACQHQNEHHVQAESHRKPGR